MQTNIILHLFDTHSQKLTPYFSSQSIGLKVVQDHIRKKMNILADLIEIENPPQPKLVRVTQLENEHLMQVIQCQKVWYL